MLSFFLKVFRYQQISLLMIFVLLLMPLTYAKAATPSYQLNQDEHLVVNYIYRHAETPQTTEVLNGLTALSSSEWSNIKLTNGDIFIQPGDNWFAFDLINNEKDIKQVYLDIANQVRMSQVDLFVKDSALNLEQIQLELLRSNSHNAKVIVSPHSKITLFLRIQSTSQLRSSLKIYSTKAYIEASTSMQFQQGLSIGGLLCLSLAFLLLFFATGNKPILILSGYFLSNTLMLSTMLGFSLSYLLPHLPALVGIEIPILTSSTATFLLIFTAQLFNLKNKFYNIYQVIRVCYWGLLLYMPLSIQLTVANNIAISMGIYALLIFSLIILGIYLHKMGSRLASLFTFVMAVQFIFVLIVIMSVNWFDIGFVAYRNIFYGILFWLNCLLVTFILSRQYRYQILDKQEAQRQALASAIESEKAKEALLKLQSSSQEELENRVQERTLELNIALQELEEVNHELEQKNTLDELTGLFNRRFYDQKILAEFRRSKRNLTPLSLVLIDIDHFKSVNDTYGHLGGDLCLSWVSDHIKESLKRSSDMAFRYGGEEFCLILPDTDAKGAVALAEALRKRVENELCIYEEQRISLTISSGVFTYLQQDNVTPETIFSNADKALYKAKGAGRNQTQVCEEQIE